MKKYISLFLMVFAIVIFLGFVVKENAYATHTNEIVQLSNVTENENLIGKFNFKDTGYPNIFNLLRNQYVLSVILIFAMIFAVIEIMTQGFGIFGTMSIILFFFYFLGNISAGNTTMISVLVFLLGVILILIEFVVPGFGAPGICGIISLCLGIILAMGDIYFAVISFAISLILSILVGLFMFKMGMESEFLKKLELLTSSTSSEGYISQEIPNLEIGNVLISVTALRPTGYAENVGFDKNPEKFEVISSDGFISKGKEIIVSRIEGSRVYVKLKSEVIWESF